MWTHDVDTGRGSKIRFFYGRHKWMAPYYAIMVITNTKLITKSTNFKVTIFAWAETLFWVSGGQDIGYGQIISVYAYLF